MTSELFSGAVPLLLFVAKATLLLVAALVATTTLRRSTAGARHLVWLAALVGVLALPLLSRIPALQIGILPAASDARDVPQTPPVMTPIGAAPAVIAGTPSPAPAPVAQVLPATPATPVTTAREVAATPPIPPRHLDMRGTPVAAPAIAPAIDFGSTPSAAFPELHASASLLRTIAIAWAGVALSLLGWLIAGAFQVRRIVARGRELSTPDWTMPLCEVADRLDLEIPPRLVMSDRIEMAFACRALAPTIVLPAAAENWSDDRRRAVLFHELSHVKRHDLLGHTLGRVACALYWFHPLVWTAAKNLRNESERACDDLVLSCGARPSEYAQHLLDMVTSVRRHGAPVMALPMARKKEFEGRMLAILDPAIRRASPGRLQSALVVASLGALSLCIAAVAPASAPRADVAAPSVASGDRAPAAARDRDTSAATKSAEHPAADTRLASPPATTPDSGGGLLAAVGGRANAESRARSLGQTQLQTQGQTQAQAQTQTHASTVDDFRLGTSGDLLTGIVASATKLGLREANRALQGLANGRPQQADTGRVLVLIKVLSTDSDAGVRRSAAWALHDIQTAGSKTSLLNALKSDVDPNVREMAAWSLAEYESADVAAALADALVHDKSAQVRKTCAWGIGSIGKPGQADALITGASDAVTEVREAAIWALGNVDAQQAPRVVINALSDNAPRIRTVAAWTLGEIGDSSAARPLVHAFETETDGSVRVSELHALTELDAVPSGVVDAAMKSSDPELRRRGVEMMVGKDASWPWPWPWPWPRPNP